MNDTTETTQYDVNLPKPRPHKILIGVLVAVLVLSVIGVAAAAIANRTAQGPGDATASLMPANTMMYFALSTHPDQLPNFNVIADAWKDSKEARMLASGLELAVTQAGVSWEDDVQPWLGDRVGFGMVDFGGPEQANSADGDFNYRAPFFIIAAQTKDRAKSDAVLNDLIKQLSSDQPIETETYRNIPISYLGSEENTANAVAWATINDQVVLTLNPENMKKVIDAALDGKTLASSANYQTVMSTLPGENAGAFYMDYAQFMPAYFDMITGVSDSMGSLYSDSQGPAQQKIEETQRRLREQIQQMREMMKAFGGVGATLSYEPTGLRFDTAMQYDPAQLPAEQRQLYESALNPASGRLFASLPASAILAVDFSLKGGILKAVLNPDGLAAQLSSLDVSKEEVTTKLAEFQKLVGVDVQNDIFNLMDGDVGLAVMPSNQQKSETLTHSMPFEAAVLFDSSDANKLAENFDKLLRNLSALSPDASVKVQSLSGLPYTVILLDDEPALVYGVVDGRLVIGTNSNTLLGIDNADQNSLVSDAAFKQATGLLPDNRLNTAYLNFQPLWDLIDAEMQREGGGMAESVPNYLKHFKWISSGAEAPANGLSKGSLHVGVGQ